MAMHAACRQGLTRAKCFCGSVLFLLLSFFFVSNAVARDSNLSKADIVRGIRTPKIDFVGNTAFGSEKLMDVLSHGKPRGSGDPAA
jgi:hypothetical protein